MSRRRRVMFLDARPGKSSDLSFIAVDDIRALAAQTYWHKVTGNFWEWVDENEEDLWLTGQLHSVEELQDSPWPGPSPPPGVSVKIHFMRLIPGPPSETSAFPGETTIEIQVDFEVLMLTPENFQVSVKHEYLQGQLGGLNGKKPPTAMNMKKTKGTMRHLDILCGRSCEQSRRTAHAIFS
eukprot:gnl/MRDRNA2_/MRDRNA2_108005_c0_seq1.p1 gnl/MRDRNA2_/MRDRNA2_108005_c0~~gnl/MRDRNA2_/MRDRNA2_108005_c0_seq1.p1  ORF type:complete len:181 (+),score=36.53 gnl/MRDRNA2_/MRDRNA2_108005_c0_seq1:93-635(+)